LRYLHVHWSTHDRDRDECYSLVENDSVVATEDPR